MTFGALKYAYSDCYGIAGSQVRLQFNLPSGISTFGEVCNIGVLSYPLTASLTEETWVESTTTFDLLADSTKSITLP